MAEIQTKQSTELSTDLTVITAEINSYKRIAGEAIFEIGRRLKHVKENDLAHGEFGKWLESINMEWRTANRMMQAVDQFANSSTSTNLPFSKIVEMLSLPSDVDREEFIKEEHEIPSTGEKKTVDEMTVKELREVKKALKEAEARAKQAEAERDSARKSEQIAIKQAEELADKPPEIKTEIKYVEVKDELAEKELEKYRNMFGDISLYENEGTKITNVQELTSKLMLFNKDVRRLLERFAHLEHYKDDITVISGEAREDFESSIKALEKFCEAFEEVNGNMNSESVIIDVEYSN
mgnify:CR=1 FL=1